MSYRIINTREAIEGPHGICYVHDAARPFAVLRHAGAQEICVVRYSTEKAAKSFIQSRIDGEPRTAAGSLD
jgi:hypothetical protein